LEWLTNGADALLVIVGHVEPAGVPALDGEDGGGLGHAPPLEDGDADAREVESELRVEGSAAADHEAQAAAEALVQLAEDYAADVDAGALLSGLADTERSLEGIEPALRLDALEDVAVHEFEEGGDAGEEGGLDLGHAVADTAEVILEGDFAADDGRDDCGDGEREGVVHGQDHHEAV